MCFNGLNDLDNFTKNEIDSLIKLAENIQAYPDEYKNICKGKILATLFYEPSTRTQMSFQAAMIRLGGNIIGFDNPMNSSVAKGEILKDTIKVVSNYSDIIAIRHPFAGAAYASSIYSSVPIINAGDGGHLHPTQTLTDIYSLSCEKKRLDNLTIGLCGDLKNGRTVHSFIRAMSKYQNNKFILISTKQLTIPDYIRNNLIENNIIFKEVFSLSEALPELDVLYMTRIQKERFKTIEDYNNQRGIYILDSKKMLKAKSDIIILHPLPRVEEISIEIDDDPRAKYFDQTKYGMYIRMALIIKMLEKEKIKTKVILSNNSEYSCSNCACIVYTEYYLPRLTVEKGESIECQYCEQRIK